MENIVVITAKAKEEIIRLLQENPVDNQGVRLGVKGGGCSGLSYVIDLGFPKEKDLIQDEGVFKVYIESRSSLYLKGSELHFNGGLADRGFKFKNPNAENTCGCGESFSV